LHPIDMPGTGRLLRPALGAIQNRQQCGRQDGDDGNDYQKFDLDKLACASIGGITYTCAASLKNRSYNVTVNVNVAG
jgi:hypothetical protein